MTVKETLTKDLQDAMKAEDVLRRETLRMVLTTIHNRELERSGKVPMPDEEIVDILRKEAKKREEASQMFAQNGRNELAEKEKKEIDIIKKYLPALMPEDDARASIKKILSSLPSKDIGPAMKAVMAELRGKADSSVVTKIVKEELVA